MAGAGRWGCTGLDPPAEGGFGGYWQGECVRERKLGTSRPGPTPREEGPLAGGCALSEYQVM